nr:ATP-binding protein [Clostridia bacterium]
MTTQQLLAPFRCAITDFNMIADGDKIAVGVSGGKDSLTLLALLKAYQRFSPQKFELAAITVDMGFDKLDFSPVADFCKANDIDYYLQKTDIAQIIFEKCPESPCSLCSRMRRGALNGKLNEIGFNKLALGHHSDDVIETFFLSLFYEGRLSTFAPTSFMSRTKITVIRPMIYISEREINAYAKNLPVVVNPCPADKHTQRQYMKDLLHNVQKDIPFVKERIFSAISHLDRY